VGAPVGCEDLSLFINWRGNLGYVGCFILIRTCWLGVMGGEFEITGISAEWSSRGLLSPIYTAKCSTVFGRDL